MKDSIPKDQQESCYEGQSEIYSESLIIIGKKINSLEINWLKYSEKGGMKFSMGRMFRIIWRVQKDVKSTIFFEELRLNLRLLKGRKFVSQVV